MKMTFQKGNKINYRRVPWNFGLTKETDERVKKYSESSRLSNIGKTLSEETKKKISLSEKGRVSPMRGRHQSESARAKISLFFTGKPKSKEHNEKVGLANTGKKKTPESKYLMYLRKLGHEQSYETIAKRKITMCDLKEKGLYKVPIKDTSIELKIQDFLQQLHFDFFTHSYMRIPHCFQCDIFIPSINTIIECDGDFFHCNPKTYSKDFVRFPNGTDRRKAKDVWERDKIRTQELEAKGIRVIRLWESEIKPMNLEQFKEKLK